MPKRKFVKRSRTGAKVMPQTCYIPADVYKELDAFCKRTGYTKSMFMLEAIRARLVAGMVLQGDSFGSRAAAGL